MAIYNFAQITSIINNNPNKQIVADGRSRKRKLRMHVTGEGLKAAILRDEYFENTDIFAAREKYAMSNKDLFQRLLHEEIMVFTARGGGATFGLPEAQEKEMVGLLSDVVYGMTLRRWIQTFALTAYRIDPASVIFMEVEQAYDPEGNVYTEPKCYPTYKSIDCIFDYLPNGRKLEYICFTLDKNDLVAFGINDPVQGNLPVNTTITSGTSRQYFRFIDDAQDVILLLQNKVLTIVQGMKQKNPIVNEWASVPAFIVSDLMKYDCPMEFVSPLDFEVELADSYLYDRSVRDLQKKYHGFAKAVEPLMECPRCLGEGISLGKACPECTVPGSDKGTGYKLRTKISDVARFPLTMWEKDNAASGFDFRSVFGYVTPDIASWDKQDTSITAIEDMMYYTYWGVNNPSKTQGPQRGTTAGDNTQETATKSLINLQPKYAKLNQTADWAESCENHIADFIGQYWFDNWQRASISYGRNYILETPTDILTIYQDMLIKGAPDNVLDEQAEKYIRALHQNNPMEMAKQMKLFKINPFPHNKALEIEQSTVIPPQDKIAKRYFGEWIDTLTDIQIISSKPDVLKDMLNAYIAPKVAEYNVQQKTTAMN